MEYVDLLVDNGEIVRVEYPLKHEDDVFDTLEYTMKRRDWWSVTQWGGCAATYIGISLDRVNMGRVIGIL